MKTRTKTSASKKSGKSGGKVRTRLTDVRGRVLGLLADGPMTSSQLVSKGGFSPASLYLNMKSLKKDGMVDTVRDGRSVMISLAGGAGAASPAEGSDESTPAPAAKRRGRPPGKKSAAKKAAGKGATAKTAGSASGGLHAALAGLSHRLTPIENSREKLLVLGQLAQSLPGPVSRVLNEVMADLTRLSHAA